MYNINKSVVSANRQDGPRIAEIFNNFIYHRKLIINTTFEQRERDREEREKESLVRELSQKLLLTSIHFPQ